MFEDIIHTRSTSDEYLARCNLTVTTSNDASKSNDHNEESTLPKRHPVSPDSALIQRLPTAQQPAFLETETALSRNEPPRSSARERKTLCESLKGEPVSDAKILDIKLRFGPAAKGENRVQRKKAINRKMDSLCHNETWTLVRR